jgi:outer membrane protein OmpA-like peptidoglycan-associated protein
MQIHRCWTSLLLLLAACPVMAQGKYTDPDSAATDAAARQALAQKHIVDIVGATSGIVGVTSGIQTVLQDLGAKVVGQQLTIDLAADVLFDFDKYTLLPKANDTLRKVGQVAASYPSSPMLIGGHTDGKGTHPYNMKLSENRADAVKNWLVANASIAGSRITTQGWGETKPVAPNEKPDGSDDPEGRQKNRRVEIVLTQTGPQTGP